MQTPEVRNHLATLSHEEMCEHIRRSLPKGALARGAETTIDIEYSGKSCSATLRFDALRGSSGFHVVDRFPPAVQTAVLAAERALLREARLAPPRFDITFKLEPFGLVPLEGFIDTCRQLVASELVARRFVLQHHPEDEERGVKYPASATLFAHFTTEHGEAVRVALATVTPLGWQERLLAWARQRAAELGVPVDELGPR